MLRRPIWKLALPLSVAVATVIAVGGPSVDAQPASSHSTRVQFLPVQSANARLSNLQASNSPLANSQLPNDRPTQTSLEGEWRLEFRFEGNSADSTSRPAPWLTFNATVVQVDSGVGGAMRSDGPSGQFGCKRRGVDVCAAGRMRLSWDEQDWQVFEFRLSPGSTDRGAGRAEIRFPNGATDRYSFTMTRTGKA